MGKALYVRLIAGTEEKGQRTEIASTSGLPVVVWRPWVYRRDLRKIVTKGKEIKRNNI